LFYHQLYVERRVQQGFNTPLSYVLTQLPLKQTIDDFWRMVAEERCHTIVLLDAVSSEDVSHITTVTRNHAIDI